MSPQEAADALRRTFQCKFVSGDKFYAALAVAIAALEREAKAEPVAWLCRYKGTRSTWVEWTSAEAEAETHKDLDVEITPLYASPPALEKSE